MSEQDDTPPSGLGRRDSQNAWARVEAKLDVYIAGMSGWRDGVDRRLADHDAMHRQTAQTMADVQLKQAAQSAVDTVQAAEKAAEKAPKVSPWTVAAVIVAGLAIVSNIILALALRAG